MTPLEVMLDNMRFAHQAAEAILRRLIESGARFGRPYAMTAIGNNSLPALASSIAKVDGRRA